MTCARPLALALPLVALGACRFDPSGVGVGGGGPDGGGTDGPGGTDAGDPGQDAAPCPEDIVVSVQVDGLPTIDPDEPIVTVLVGDTVTLSADGSCARVGPLRFAWALSPLDSGVAQTALPGLDEATFTIYPPVAGKYYVTLVVTDGLDRTETVLSFLAFEARGFERRDGLPGAQDIRDLAAGDGRLWIATKDGPHATELADPGEFTDLGAKWNGSDPPNDLGTVHFEAAGEAVWFGARASNTVVWRAALAEGKWQAIPYDGQGALGGPATVRGLTDADMVGVWLASTLGITTWTDGAAFSGRIEPTDDDVQALVASPVRSWAGGRALWAVDAPQTALQPFGALPDQKIRALAVDVASGWLWVGSDSEGVARVKLATGEVQATWKGAASGLPSNKIQAIAVETSGPYAGDVWFATDSGFARWKRDRDRMVPLGDRAGLTSRLNLRDAVFDGAGGRRAIFGGSSTGLVYIHLP